MGDTFSRAYWCPEQRPWLPLAKEHYCRCKTLGVLRKNEDAELKSRSTGSGAANVTAIAESPLLFLTSLGRAKEPRCELSEVSSPNRVVVNAGSKVELVVDTHLAEGRRKLLVAIQ